MSIRDEEADLIAAYKAEYDLAVAQGRLRHARRVAAVLERDHGVQVAPSAPEKAVAEPALERAVPEKPAARSRKPKAAKPS